ncbi:hypothetical protein ABK040_016286 [Willaertia magna]
MKTINLLNHCSSSNRKLEEVTKHLTINDNSPIISSVAPKTTTKGISKRRTNKKKVLTNNSSSGAFTFVDESENTKEYVQSSSPNLVSHFFYTPPLQSNGMNKRLYKIRKQLKSCNNFNENYFVMDLNSSSKSSPQVAAFKKNSEFFILDDYNNNNTSSSRVTVHYNNNCSSSNSFSPTQQLVNYPMNSLQQGNNEVIHHLQNNNNNNQLENETEQILHNLSSLNEDELRKQDTNTLVKVFYQLLQKPNNIQQYQPTIERLYNLMNNNINQTTNFEEIKTQKNVDPVFEDIELSSLLNNNNSNSVLFDINNEEPNLFFLEEQQQEPILSDLTCNIDSYFN